MPRPPRLAAVLAAATTLLALPLAGAAQAAQGPDQYVALGDSYAAGNGTSNYNLDYSCARSTDAYAPIIAAERPGTALSFLACGGAKTGDVLANQLGTLSSDTDYVTLSIGGNDVGFTSLILGCWNWLDTSGCLSTIDSTNARIAGELPAKLDQTYAAIRSRAPKAKVIIVGYPHLLGDTVGCSQADGITATEAPRLNALVDNLNATIAQRARANGFTFVNPVAAFDGHDVCSSSRYVWGKWAPLITDIYHPTKAGYRNGYAPLVRAVMG
ncbi:MAG: SGNH/GDSL hydrolase family protein [Micrococcales bacterium]|nr:SGNH/GDSL hydrolase family protein [Micrococcales bacterium]